MRSALDTVVPTGFARERLQPRLAVQGNLDPVALLVGGAALERAVADDPRGARRAARSCSISGTACCRRRRRNMSPTLARAR